MDWAELNPDILRLIAKKVGDISNFIRFRAVCKYWRLVVPLSNLPQQLPYFIQFKRKSASSFDIQFGSLFANITHTLSVQISQLKGEPMVCSLLTSGYVLLRFFQYSKTWILLNPLTGFQVPIPFAGIDDIPIYFGPSCSPNSVENEIDVVFQFEKKLHRIVCLWRYADRKWTKITEVICKCYEYVRYTNYGRLYTFSKLNRDTRVIDIMTGDVVSFMPASSIDHMHYLTEAYGNLLRVQRCLKSFNLLLLNREYLIDVYQLEDAGTNPRWIKVNDIGDRMLFFDHGGSCLCLKASDFEGCRGNRIYLMDFMLYNKEPGWCFLKYEMESKTQMQLYPYELTKKLQRDDYEISWFVPSLI
ncbi:F-box/kelch-repeat protein At1g64840-like [Carex rostrata]